MGLGIMQEQVFHNTGIVLLWGLFSRPENEERGFVVAKTSQDEEVKWGLTPFVGCFA